MMNAKYIPCWLICIVIAISLCCACSRNKSKESNDTAKHLVYETITIHDTITIAEEASNHPKVNKSVNRYSNYWRDNIADEYNDRFYDYLDDPEDELTYDPEIFEFSDDY